MKRNILLVLLAAVLHVGAIAQTTKNKSMDQILGNKAFQEASNASTTYNQNVNANMYLTDLSERWIMGVNVFEKYESKLVKTGRKDPAGNEILHIHFFKDGVLTYVLVPDFEDCPMFYLLYGVSNELIHTRAASGGSYSNTQKVRVANRKRVYQLTPTKGQSFYRTGDGGGTLDVTSSPKALDYDQGVAWCYFDYRTDYGELKANNNKRLLTDWTARWNAAHDWAERQIKSVEGKSYDELIKNTNLGEAFLKNSTTFDSCRVSYKLDDQQKLKEVVFQFPFLDNAYYDKEQFFAKAIKNREGLFEVSNTQKSLNIGDKRILVPLEKRLLLCFYDSYNKTYRLDQIISPNYADALETNILHDSRVYAIDGEIESKDMNKTTEAYGEWWKRKNFSQEYNHAADLVIFSNFITKYMQSLKK